MLRQKRRLFVLSAFVLVSFAACGDEPAAALRAAISEGCAINSDCSSPLVCAFRTCHIECESTRDCVPYGGGLCVQSDKPYKVCQNPDEQLCSLNSECPGRQVCGPDGKCRDACATNRDCVAGQTCAAGACAEPVELIEGKLPAKAAPEGGLSCLLPSDCPGDLVCKFNTCTVECVTAKDCDDGVPCTSSRCEYPPVGGGGRGGAGGGAGASNGGAGGALVGGAAGASGGGSGNGGSAAVAGNGGSGGTAGTSAGGMSNGGTAGSGAGAAGRAGGGQGGSAGNGGEGGIDSGSAGNAGTGSGVAGNAGTGSGVAGNAGTGAGVAGSAGAAGQSGQAGSAGSGGGTNPPPLGLTVLATTPGSTYLALDRDNVYWLTVVGKVPDTKGTVYTMPKLGGLPIKLAEVASPVALGLDDASVYYGSFGLTGNIFRVAKTPVSQPVPVTKSIDGITDFSVEGSTIVFTDANSVSYIDLVDAKKNDFLVGGATTPYTMTRRGGFVFWADAQTDTRILRAPIAPPAIKVNQALIIAQAPKTKPRGIAVDATQVFWTEPETRQVRSAPVDGGTAQTLVTDTVAPFEIALDDTRVYWTGSNNVSSMNKDGSDRVTYDANGKSHRAVAVDDTWVFWVDAALGTVNRVGK